MYKMFFVPEQLKNRNVVVVVAILGMKTYTFTHINLMLNFNEIHSVV